MGQEQGNDNIILSTIKNHFKVPCLSPPPPPPPPYTEHHLQHHHHPPPTPTINNTLHWASFYSLHPPFVEQQPIMHAEHPFKVCLFNTQSTDMHRQSCWPLMPGAAPPHSCSSSSPRWFAAASAAGPRYRGLLSSLLQSVNQWFITRYRGLPSSPLQSVNQWFITCLFTPRCTAISHSVVYNMLPGPPVFSTTISQSVVYVCSHQGALQSVNQWFITRYRGLPSSPLQSVNQWFITCLFTPRCTAINQWFITRYRGLPSSPLQSVNQWFITCYLGLCLLHCNQSISGL